MLSDLNRVDFNNVQEQASWVCNLCKSETVRIIEVIDDLSLITLFVRPFKGIGVFLILKLHLDTNYDRLLSG